MGSTLEHGLEARPGRQAIRAELSPARRPPWQTTLRRLMRNPAAMAGATIIVVLIAIALFAPRVVRFGEIDAAGKSLQPPNATNWLGTDVLGRDVFSRILLGTRISLSVGVLSVLIGVSLGLLLGLVAGFYTGKVDAAIVMLIDTMLAFPGILLAIAIVAVLGPGLTNVMIAVGISSVPGYTRLVRGSVLQTREEEYVTASRVAGCRASRMMFRHIMPNVLTPVIVLATLDIPTAILSAAGLSFLSLGAQPPTPEWGAMVSDGRNYLKVAWWLTTGPGVAIMLTVLAINQFGDGLRDALDPRMRTSGR
jgi:peptide/nickel transport system permease protein